MKPRHLLILAIVIIFLTPYSFSYQVICTCTGECHGRDVEQSAARRKDLYSISEEEECLQRAKTSFGAHCGGLTNCNSGCVELGINIECEEVKTKASSCCKDWCTGFSGDEEYCGCIQSCEANCRTNELIGQLISILQYISVVIVAIMLAINGIKFITSDSPYDRDQAKASIRYVIIALIILALVTYIATTIFFPVRVPGGDTSLKDEDCTSFEVTGEDICLDACTEVSCTDINSYISGAISGLSSKNSLMDSSLVLAVIKQESGFHQCSGGKVITSSAGAMGLMQLMPGTADGEGVDPCDAQDNVKGGVSYLNKQLNNFDDRELALAAYNWGPGYVACSIGKPWSACASYPGYDKCGGACHSDPTWACLRDNAACSTPSETEGYVTNIMGYYGSVSC